MGWLALFSDVKLWLDGGLATFGMNTAEVGALRAVLATGVYSDENDTDASDDEDEQDETELTAREPRSRRASVLPLEPAPVRHAEPEPIPAVGSLEDGNRWFDDGEFELARTQFEAVLAAEPEHAQAHNNLGQTLVRLGHPAEAVEHLEAATRLDPGSWAYRFNLAHTLAELGWWHRAVAEYRQAATLFPDDYATQYNVGRALHEWGDYRAAAESYLRAIAIAPNESRFYLSLATTYEAMARPADAAEAYDRYLSMEPGAGEREAIEARAASLRAAVAAAAAGP